MFKVCILLYTQMINKYAIICELLFKKEPCLIREPRVSRNCLSVTLASVKRTANLVLQVLENLSYRYVLTIAAAAPEPPPPLL